MPNKAQSNWPLRLWSQALPIGVFGVGVVCAVLAWQAASDKIEQARRQAFESDADDATEALRSRIQRYIDLLLGLQALFASSDEVTQRDFADYLASLDFQRNYPGIQAVQFARFVKHENKALFEQRVRAERGYFAFQIHPPGKRASYVAVEFNEPMTGNERAYGHDQIADPVRREVMERARDWNQPAASAPIELVQDDVKTPGFVMRVPVYAHHAPINTLEQRIAAFSGQVTGVFRAADVLKGTLSPHQLQKLQLRVTDIGLAGAAPNVPKMLFKFDAAQESETTARYGAHAAALRTYERDLTVAGRQWRLQFSTAVAPAYNQPLPMVLLLSGLLISAMLAWIVRHLATQRDRLEQLARRITARLRESEERLRAVLHGTADGIVTVDEQANVRMINPAGARMLGYTQEELAGAPLTRLIPPTEHAAFWQTLRSGALLKALQTNSAARGYDVMILRKNGSSFAAEVSVSPADVDGQRHFVGIVRDVTERREAEERIRRLALHDTLTGLPNRTLLIDRYTQAAARIKRHGGLLAMLFVDLDHFKRINDTLGHQAGDELLRNVAQRLRVMSRKTDTVARMGGDEFVLLLTDLPSAEHVHSVAGKLLRALAAPFTVAGQSLHVSPSVGVSFHPGDGADFDTLLKHADTAMYRAKEGGRNQYRFFEASMNEGALERLALENDLRGALARDELELHFQPQLNLATQEISTIEALVRWNHPQRGLLSAAQFIAIAEETGLIVQLGDWVLRHACRRAKSLQRAAGHPFKLAVNLSAQQFRNGHLVASVTAALRDSGWRPQQLELEITESLLLASNTETLDQIAQLRALGVRLAIDDFGTGYSNLGYLKDLPLDTIKIDRSFVHDIVGNKGSDTITRAIVTLARGLNVRVVAEGVETHAQYEQLRAIGCDDIQGYLFSHPLPGDDATWNTWMNSTLVTAGRKTLDLQLHG